MNILFYYKYFPNVGGVETVITVLANEFVRLGHKVGVVSFNQNESAKIDILDKRICLYTLPNKSCLSCQENIDQVVKLINYEGYSILFNHDSVSDSMEFVGKVKKQSDCQLVTLHHGAIYLSKDSLYHLLRTSDSRWRKFISKAKTLAYLMKVLKCFVHQQKNIQISDKYVCLCEAYRKQLYRPSKTAVIYNPLSYPDLILENERTKKQNIVLFVGRVSEFPKRLTIMLDIWHSINTEGWQFLIIGDGPDRVFIEDYIKKNHINNVIMLGYQNPRPFYKKSKIFLMTSSTEGFPMTISEAKQYGCVPVAMDSFESIHECIKDGIDGIIVANNDKNTFSMSLYDIMNSPDRLDLMSRNAVKNSTNRTASLISGQWIELFNSLLDNNNN